MSIENKLMGCIPKIKFHYCPHLFHLTFLFLLNN